MMEQRTEGTSRPALAGRALSVMDRGAVWVLLIATVSVNAIASIFRLGGNTPGSVSNRYEVFFTPAGYVFGIWSVIYTGLFAFAFYQSFVRGEASVRVASIVRPFLVTCVANMTWIFSWHYELLSVSMAVMLVLLGSLLVIYHHLGDENGSMSFAERLTMRWPLRIYTAWISVATLANLSILLEAENLRPFAMSAETWAIVMLALASAVAIVVGLVRRDAVFLLVFAWAFIGIAVKNGPSTPVFDAALAALSVVVAMLVSVIARSSFWTEYKSLSILTAFAVRTKSSPPPLTPNPGARA